MAFVKASSSPPPTVSAPAAVEPLPSSPPGTWSPSPQPTSHSPVRAPPSREPTDVPRMLPVPRPVLRTEKVTKWFKVAASPSIVEADRKRMDAEHQSTMAMRSESDLATKDSLKSQATESARDRQRRKRQREKDDDIEAGRRDLNGKVIKVSRIASLSQVLVDPGASSLNVAEASRPKRTLHEQERQQRGKVGRPRQRQYTEAIQTNWMNPLLWTHIEKAGKICRPHMRPADICRELKKMDPVLFKVLVPQTLGKWIDTSGDSPQWSARTLERVAAGIRPGGLTTRVGILVSLL